MYDEDKSRIEALEIMTFCQAVHTARGPEEDRMYIETISILYSDFISGGYQAYSFNELLNYAQSHFGYNRRPF